MIQSRAAFFRRLAVTVILVTAVGNAIAPRAHAAKPKVASIDLTISNKQCFGGKGIDPYIQQAISQRRRAAAKGNAGELSSFFVVVPSRPWRGLTVTGIGLHYERTSVYFREPLARVRQVLRAAGVRIESNGSIPMTSEEAVEVQVLKANVGEARRFGPSEVECGV